MLTCGKEGGLVSDPAFSPKPGSLARTQQWDSRRCPNAKWILAHLQFPPSPLKTHQAPPTGQPPSFPTRPRGYYGEKANTLKPETGVWGEGCSHRSASAGVYKGYWI